MAVNAWKVSAASACHLSEWGVGHASARRCAVGLARTKDNRRKGQCSQRRVLGQLEKQWGVMGMIERAIVCSTGVVGLQEGCLL